RRKAGAVLFQNPRNQSRINCASAGGDREMHLQNVIDGSIRRAYIRRSRKRAHIGHQLTVQIDQQSSLETAKISGSDLRQNAAAGVEAPMIRPGKMALKPKDLKAELVKRLQLIERGRNGMGAASLGHGRMDTC